MIKLLRSDDVLKNILGFMVFPFVIYAGGVTLLALAQGLETGEVGGFEFAGDIWTSIHGLRGASVLGATGLVSQLVGKFARTETGSKVVGGKKLGIIAACTYIAGVIGLVGTGVAPLAAILHTSVLYAGQVTTYESGKYLIDWLKKKFVKDDAKGTSPKEPEQSK